MLRQSPFVRRYFSVREQVMRNQLLSAILVSALPFCATVPTASAKDVELRRTIKAGEATDLLPHSSMRGECESKIPKIRILDQPRNGTATIREGERKFEKGTGNFAKCDGKVGVGANVVYTPKGGFEGADRFRYEVTYDSGRTATYAVSLRVGRQDSSGWTKPKQ